jgi:GNAT superfamily N-acetyltransferase
LSVDPAGEVVGTAAVWRLAPRVAELSGWLRPDYRGRGLAPRLMDRCLEEARALGAACCGWTASDTGWPRR